MQVLMNYGLSLLGPNPTLSRLAQTSRFLVYWIMATFGPLLRKNNPTNEGESRLNQEVRPCLAC